LADKAGSVANPIFTAIYRAARAEIGLFDVMAAAARGDLLDLPRMAAHQRAPLVTAVAILMHVLAKYAKVEREDAQSWALAWDTLIGSDSLRITAPHDEVAFLQPPTNKPTSRQSIEAADLLLPNVEHEVKRTWSTNRPEIAIFSLIGSLSRPNVKDHRSSTRTGFCGALPSIDGTLGSEICGLLSAYDQLDYAGERPATASDHFIWLRPYRPSADTPLPFADVPRPFLDVGRPQRIVATPNGSFEIWACPNNTIRVSGADPWLDDPHTPKSTTKDGVHRYKLAAKTFDHRFQHRVLFGAVDKLETIERPRILDLIDYRYLRLCALGTDQGKTRGYCEAMFIAARSEGLFCLDPPRLEDRPARLSSAALATIDTGSKILFAALAVLYPDADDLSNTDKSRIRTAQLTYYDAVGHKSVQLVFDLLNVPENVSDEQKRLDVLIAAEVRRVFNLAATALVRPLHAARASNRLEAGIHFRLRGEAMSKEFNPPPLARQVFAILRDMAEHATPDDRARLRTMFLPEPSFSFWKMMAAVPQEQTDNERCLGVWKIILRALGHVRPSSGSLGRTLGSEGFPEDRLDRLLTASGSSLPGLIDEALRWVISHRVETTDLSILATLGVADVLGDREARDWARKQVAIDYVRFADREKGAKGSSKGAPQMREAS
jgi:hypothetical protein